MEFTRSEIRKKDDLVEIREKKVDSFKMDELFIVCVFTTVNVITRSLKSYVLLVGFSEKC